MVPPVLLADEVGVPWARLADASPGDAESAPSATVTAGVPHFVFNGTLFNGQPFNGPLSLSGAQDPATLLAAMRQAVQAPPALAVAHG